jgi:hypothetical protein
MQRESVRAREERVDVEAVRRDDRDRRDEEDRQPRDRQAEQAGCRQVTALPTAQEAFTSSQYFA